MSAFDAIEIGWAGKKYTIPADRVLQCIAKVEDVITLHELLVMGEQGRVKLVPISRAYATVLRFAGCEITDDEAYAGVFRQGATQEAALNCIGGLLTMLLPSNVKSDAAAIAEAVEATKGKGRSRPSKAAASSRNTGRRR